MNQLITMAAPKLTTPALAPAALMIEAGKQLFSIVESASKIMEYRARIREIDEQIYRVKQEAKVMMNRISCEHDITIKRLENERDQSRLLFSAYLEAQENALIDQENIARERSLLIAEICKPGLSLDEKQLLVQLLQMIDATQKEQLGVKKEMFLSLVDAIRQDSSRAFYLPEPS